MIGIIENEMLRITGVLCVALIAMGCWEPVDAGETDSQSDTATSTTTMSTDSTTESGTVTDTADTSGDTAVDTVGDSAVDSDTVVDTEPVCVPTDEVCDLQDNDCDGKIDEGTDDVAYSATVTCWVDADDDGFAVLSADLTHQCDVCGTGYTAREPIVDSADCDDHNVNVYPGNTEVCNGMDDNCDMLVDENSAGTEYGLAISCWVDADNDTYAHIDAAMVKECGSCGDNQVSVAPDAATSDCNDENSAVNPGADEICDDFVVDENCDGISNPGCSCTQGIEVNCPLPGVCATGLMACSAGEWQECTVSPVEEVCNEVDDDCDGSVDEGVTTTCYADADGDGYALSGADVSTVCGNCPTATTSIAPGATTTDCDDADPNIKPGGDEICNLKDDDCDGLNDETGSVNFAQRTTCYKDVDGDGYAVSGAAPDNGFCGACPSGYTALEPVSISTIDCEDSTSEGADIHPGQTDYFREPYCTTAASYNSTNENCCPKGTDFCFVSILNPPKISNDYNCDGVDALALKDFDQCYPTGCPKGTTCDCTWVWDATKLQYTCDDKGRNTALTFPMRTSVSAACR